MSASPVDVVGQWMQNLLDHEVINRVVAPDATYVSLNTQEYNPYSKRTRTRLQDYLSDNIWVTTSGNFNDQALITALLTVSADRIMFASDYPYDMSTDAARWIEVAPISENDRRKICYGNAAALFGLPR